MIRSKTNQHLKMIMATPYIKVTMSGIYHATNLADIT